MGQDVWCNSADDLFAWDGIDFGLCFRRRYIDGLLPLLALVLSLGLLVVPPTLRWSISRLIRPQLVLPANDNSSRLGATEYSANPLVTEVENVVVAAEAKLEGVPVPQEWATRAAFSSADAVKSHDAPLNKRGSLLRGLRKSKSAALEVILSCIVVILLASTLVLESRPNSVQHGTGWLGTSLLVWLYFTGLAGRRLYLLLLDSAIIWNGSELPQGPSTELTRLPAHLVAFSIAYFFIVVLDWRSVMLKRARWSTDTLLICESALLGTLALLVGVQIFTPFRPAYEERRRAFAQHAKAQAKEELQVQSAEEYASLWSYGTFGFFDGFIRKYARTAPTRRQVPDLLTRDRSGPVLLAFRSTTYPSWLGKSPNLALRLFWFFRSDLIAQQCWAWIAGVLMVLPAFFLQNLIDLVGDRAAGLARPAHVTVLFAGGLALSTFLNAIVMSQALYIGRLICIDIRCIVVGEVFAKALRKQEVNSGERKEGEQEIASSGKINNLVAVDSFRLSEICAYLHFMWPQGPVTLVLTTAFLFKVLGLAAIAGVIVMLALIPIQVVSSRFYLRFQASLLKAADRRLELAQEIITSIRHIKFFAYESQFLDQLTDARNNELAVLRQRLVAFLVSCVTYFVSPIFIALATFATHTKILGRPLEPSEAFTAILLFSIMRGALDMLADLVVNVQQAWISLKRIDVFLREEDTAKWNDLLDADDSEVTERRIGFSDATFAYSVDATCKPEGFALRDLNFDFADVGLSLVIGTVGAGKSSLLQALLGEMRLVRGKRFLPSPISRRADNSQPEFVESTAFCAQQPWLLSDTIKENILYGCAFRDVRYREVLHACALDKDLEQYEQGDMTEVGESGTILSGGQKARLSLARALYSQARVLLLDDILSAVDSSTQVQLLHALTGPLMRGRACILVTHAVSICLPKAAFVVIMKGGKVKECGPPHTLSSTPTSGFATPLAGSTSADVKSVLTKAIAEKLGPAQPAPTDKPLKKLHEIETSGRGQVSWRVYSFYLAATAGVLLWILILGTFIAGQVADVGTNAWLRQWAGSYSPQAKARVLGPYALFVLDLRKSDDPTDYYLKIFVLISAASVVLYLVRMTVFLWRGLTASRTIHKRLIESLLGATVRFYDTTPVGRIMNRLSKDLETIDQDIPSHLLFLLTEIIMTIGTLLAIAFAVPKFLLAGIGITALYTSIAWAYLGSSRELKRMESITRSPLFSLFGECLQGVVTIRSYGDSSRMLRKIFTLLNETNRPFINLWRANRWLSVRADACGALVSLATALFVLLNPSIDAALAGFALSYAMSFNERVLWLLRYAANVELNFNSVERVHEYLNLPQEPTDGLTPSRQWPSPSGSGIEFKDVRAQYAVDTEIVLHEVSFKVRPGEKVGIVGRTGSGKSTLTNVLFRLMPFEGQVIIDGVDTHTIALKALRSRLTTIPQTPLLWQGTIRFNLSPFGLDDDASLWSVLQRVGLVGNSGSQIKPESGITDLELETLVAEGGKNLSQGQRQLLAFARGLLQLKHSNILVLDESTASLDQAADERIQQALREETDTTILTIAHRLATIIDFDRVLVLSHGRVVEYDTPYNLLAKPDSAFSELCRASGEDALFRDRLAINI